MKIQITKKDINPTFTDSRMLIDELSYSAKQWTSDELWENNIEYEPNEPYEYNFEKDLFEHTKTREALGDTIKKIKIDFPIGIKVKNASNLQAGAQIALNFPEVWNELLEAYTQALKDQRSNDDIISEQYEAELQEAIEDYQKEQYHEWLNGDRSNYAGVLSEIAKFYGASEPIDYNEKEPYTAVFAFEDEALAELMNLEEGEKPTEDNARAFLLSEIKSASEARGHKDREANEKRKAERESRAEYKAKQAQVAEKERKAKLLAMTK
jgi:hypothetical protein